MHRRQHRLTAALCGLVLAAAQTAPAFAQADDASAREAAGLIATAEALDAFSDSVDRTRFDVKALAAALSGAGPEGAKAWIAENTRLVAYRGTLKGASGTLEDRAGNSLDRALLLVALLQANGVEARLARAELSPEAAAELAKLTGGSRPTQPDVNESAGLAIVEKLANDPRIDGARYRAFIEAETARQAEVKAGGEAMATTLIAALTPALSPDDAAARAAASAAALGDHWWAQANIDGGWVDLDPAGAGVSAAATLSPEDVPDDLKHKVTLRVVAEVAREGALTTATLVESTLASADIQGDVISLAHRTGGLIPADEQDGTDAALFASAGGAKVWAPLFIVDKTVRGDLVAAGGEVAEATEANFSKYSGTSTFDNAASAIDAIGAEEETETPGVFTAEWLEVEIAAPGAEPVTERRLLFDAIGSEARASGRFEGELDEAAKIDRGLALQDDIDLAIMTGAMSKDRAARRSAALAAVGLRAVAAVATSDADAPAPEAPEGYRRPAAELSEFAAGRFALATADAEIVAPNLALLRAGTRARDGEAVDLRGFDIIANAVAGTPASALAAGVADTVSEHLLLGAAAGSNNTAARHAADLAAGRTWTLIASAEALAGVTDDATTRALMAADLARGYALVAPERLTAADATWWRVDPNTGVTLGMTTAGGAETVEYLGTLEISMMIGWGVCTLKGKNFKKKAGGKWGNVKMKERMSTLACYAGVVVGVFSSSAALGLLVGAAGTAIDEVN